MEGGRTSAPHWSLRAGRGTRLRPRPDAAPPKNGENNGRGRPICGLPLDHRRSKSDCDWTPVEDEGDHTPSTDLNSASPFPQSPVLNTWVSSCIIGAPPERAPAGVHSLVMRRKYVLWRCALVCERLFTAESRAAFSLFAPLSCCACDELEFGRQLGRRRAVGPQQLQRGRDRWRG